MVRKLIIKFVSIFDLFSEKIESSTTHQQISTGLVIVFLVSILVIWLNKNLFLPDFISHFLPENIFRAVEVVFTFLLVVEILEMILILSRSVSDAMAKQFEILSLILLRQSFKEFASFEVNLDWTHIEPILHIASDAFSALFIFICVTIFLKIQRHYSITKNLQEQANYMNIKKILALIMLFTFVFVGIENLYEYLVLARKVNFFHNFYNILIFTDILLVLISMRYSHSYFVLFRNSGYALTTVMIRLALSAPIYINGIIGVSAVVFAIILTIVYNKYGIYSFVKNDKTTEEFPVKF